MAKKVVMDLSVFGERLRYARIQNGFTKTELARQCLVSIPAIQKYENGDYAPSFYIFYRLAKALFVSPEWLAGLEKDDSCDDVEKAREKFSKISDAVDLGTGLETAYTFASVLEELWTKNESVMCRVGSVNEELMPKSEEIKALIRKLKECMDGFVPAVKTETSKTLLRSLSGSQAKANKTNSLN